MASPVLIFWWMVEKRMVNCAQVARYSHMVF